MMKGTTATQIRVTSSESSSEQMVQAAASAATSYRTRLQERRSSSSTRAHLSLPLNASQATKSSAVSPSFYGPSVAALVAASCPSTAAATPTGLGPGPLVHPVLNLLKVSHTPNPSYTHAHVAIFYF